MPGWDGRTTITPVHGPGGWPGGWPGPPCGAAGPMALTQIPARARSPDRRSSRLNPGPDPRPSLPSQADRRPPSHPRQADGRARATKCSETVKIKTAPQPVYTQALSGWVAQCCLRHGLQGSQTERGCVYTGCGAVLILTVSQHFLARHQKSFKNITATTQRQPHSQRIRAHGCLCF